MNDRASTTRSEVIDFGSFRLVPSTRALTRNGAPVPLGDRALDILIALIERRGQVVSKKDLFEIVWPETVVEESNLRVHVAALRKALGDGQSGSRFITNVPGRGYAFLAEVQRSGTDDIDAVPTGPSPSDGRSKLPASLNRLVGRDEIVALIAKELTGRRFVTITGPGGIGKTAVALAVAAKIAGTYRDGVRLLDLATLPSPTLVVAHLASVLRLPTTDTQALDVVAARLRTRNLLLVFDNCEHVVDAASAVAEEILQRAAEVHILATSREPLRATGECVQRLAPLACPPVSKTLTLQEALAFPAVRLFVDRVRACDASFTITDADAPVIADLCTRLDGLPLAIELAAGRVLLFGIRGVADRLDDRFGLLTKGLRTAVPRHQALGALIDWSYQTLSSDEKTLWRRLSVFNAMFTLEAATAIGHDGAADDLSVIDILDSLVEKSLVAVELLASEARYRMLESLRLYAFNKLSESAEADCVRRNHAEYYLRCSFGSGDNWLETPSAQWLESHSGDIADIRAAINWAFSSDNPLLAIRLICASAPFWFKLLFVPELRGLLEHALQLAPGLPQIDDGLLMRLHFALGHSIFHMLGPVDQVSQSLESALAIADRRRDINAQLQILWTRFGNLVYKGHYAYAMASVERVRRIMVDNPEEPVAPLYNGMAALAYHLLGDQQNGLRHAELALDHAAVKQRAGRDGVFVYDHKTAASAHYARILWITGNPDSALEVIRGVIEDPRNIDQPFATGFFLVFAAVPVSLWSGELQAARRHVSSLLDVASRITFDVWLSAGMIYQQALKFLQNAADADSVITAQSAPDAVLPRFLMDNLATFSRQLLHPRAAAAAMDGEGHWCTAEILRAKGESLLLAGGSAQDAGKLFERSIEISRTQKALSWELRSATSLARLWRAENRTLQAANLLADVYRRFTEGFATRDLIDAKALLDSLS